MKRYLYIELRPVIRRRRESGALPRQATFIDVLHAGVQGGIVARVDHGEGFKSYYSNARSAAQLIDACIALLENQNAEED